MFLTCCLCQHIWSSSVLGCRHTCRCSWPVRGNVSFSTPSCKVQFKLLLLKLEACSRVSVRAATWLHPCSKTWMLPLPKSRCPELSLEELCGSHNAYSCMGFTLSKLVAASLAVHVVPMHSCPPAFEDRQRPGMQQVGYCCLLFLPMQAAIMSMLAESLRCR